ncbi:SEC-C metal-binding domain-containing protein [Virgibacillus sp. 179-BFC.A HS]|uniref:SEC-C metal-binding domain-containing protein n=1 Tax=Tigheibacillus jepli TaxID=3035914 RepID=A0ABU5CJB5_9BACI|nr:SEC-C metal-binding domain-containing protein [Virgibacillus sp. 179-BFC.A HS]MDY0406446.1 SEC-C metal-binding domain-containing protein [Virgibacillus sp. 179-BFC.A HS]
MKKDELIALLQEKIAGFLTSICSVWDNERFKLLTDIASKGGKMIAPDLEPEQIDYFRTTGLIYTGTLNGTQIVAVPSDLTEQIINLKNDAKIKKTIKRNTAWIKLTRGLLYYYGTLSSSQLVKMVENYTKEKINVVEYMTVIENSNSYNEEMRIDEEGFSNIRVFDSERVKKEHQLRKDLPYYPFTKQQLITAGEPDYVEKNKSYMQLVNFLTHHFEIDHAEADNLAEECVYATRIGDGTNDVLEFLSHNLEFNHMETVESLMIKVVELMNNTREWFLKGYTSSELLEQEKKHLQPLPADTFSQSNSNETKNVKVGRNDPCPCGSGKKYKKCCGR